MKRDGFGIAIRNPENDEIRVISGAPDLPDGAIGRVSINGEHAALSRIKFILLRDAIDALLDLDGAQ